MKKFLCLLTVIAMLFSSFAFVSFAAEIDAQHDHNNNHENDHPHNNGCGPFYRYMGDIDNDGKVTAADARTVLRASVGLEEYRPDRFAYADIDFDGSITAADARLALRMSVGLEETVSHNFSQCKETYPTCLKEGSLAGKCINCELTVNVILPKDTHCPETWDCSGKRRCIVCRTEYEVAPSHSYQGYMCIYCNDVKKTDFYNDLAKYMKTNGVYEEGVYYIEETVEYETFSLCYDPSDNSMYAFAGTAFETEDSQVVYYFNYIDFDSSFSTYTIELDCYLEDTLVAYGIYELDETKLNNVTPGSLTLSEFDAVPELAGMQAELEIISEGLAYDTILWINQVAQNLKSCDAMKIMGFTAM